MPWHDSRCAQPENEKDQNMGPSKSSVDRPVGPVRGGCCNPLHFLRFLPLGNGHPRSKPPLDAPSEMKAVPRASPATAPIERLSVSAFAALNYTSVRLITATGCRCWLEFLLAVVVSSYRRRPRRRRRRCCCLLTTLLLLQQILVLRGGC